MSTLISSPWYLLIILFLNQSEWHSEYWATSYFHFPEFSTKEKKRYQRFHYGFHTEKIFIIEGEVRKYVGLVFQMLDSEGRG